MERDWKQAEIQLVGQILNGILERDTTILDKIVDDVFYKRLAKHAVKIARACIEELKKEKEIDF